MLMSNKISIMMKRLNLATRAFGAEPGLPDVAVLAEWIAEHRGRQADITTYRIEQSLSPQIAAEIGTPCAGGTFLADRILAAISGVEDQKAVGELHPDPAEITEDAAGIVVLRRGTWCALPAPHTLSIEDAFFGDSDEWNEAICGIYKTLMRAMRDTGVAGHVLICDTAEDAELAALARQKVFFFHPSPNHEDLAGLLEHQHQIAVGKDQVKTLFDLTGEYTLRKIFILDPDQKAITLAREHLDPDQIVAGGYCTDESGTYWKDLVKKAVYEK
jgi:hypothetical protein